MRVTADRRPALPFQSTSADLFSCQGWEYLVYVDRHTGWPCIAKIGRTASSADVIRVSVVGSPTSVSPASSLLMVVRSFHHVASLNFAPDGKFSTHVFTSLSSV